MEVRREKVLELQRRYIQAMRDRAEPMEVEAAGLRLTILPGAFPPYLDSSLVIGSMRIDPDDEVLEVGTGSGVIALAAAKTARRVVATDLNPAAVQTARLNARRLDARLEIVEADLFPAPEAGPFDVVVFNPPYTDHAAEDAVERSVWDPGHLTVRRFLQGLPKYLRPGGRLYLGWADFADLSFVESLITSQGGRFQRLGEARDDTSLFVAYRVDFP